MDSTTSQQLTDLRRQANALCEAAGHQSMHDEEFSTTQLAWFELRREIKRLERLREEEVAFEMNEKLDVAEFMRTWRVWTNGDQPILESGRRTKMWLRRLERDPVMQLLAEFVTTHFKSAEGLDSMRHTTRWVMPAAKEAA